MKKILIISLIIPLFLISCGKTEEVKTVVNPPVVEKQAVVNPPVVESPVVVTGSVVESGSGEIEEVSTGVVSEGGIEGSSGVSIIDTSKDFNLDDYLKQGTYYLIDKSLKDNYSVYTVNPRNDWNKEDCYNYCVIFITKSNKLLFTNLVDNNKGSGAIAGINNNMGGFYKFGNDGVIFNNVSSGGGMGTSITSDMLTYINFKTLKKIYENYVTKTIYDLDENENEIKSSKRIEYIKNFFSSPGISDPNKKLNIKATDIEDAYFEYYKEAK